jgi:hypothetical protein
LLIVPIQVPGSANYQAFARAAGSGAYYATSCQAMAIAPNNTGWSFSYKRSSNVSTTPVSITLGVIGVPPQGTAHFECWVSEYVHNLNGGGTGGRVINVELI